VSDDDLAAVTDALFAVIPGDVTESADGGELDADSIAGIRRQRAANWARAGHTDPARVRAWITAGVLDEWVARRAERLGFRPGDPWVPKGFFVNDPEWSMVQASNEEYASSLQVLINRRQARRRWREKQLEAAAGVGRLERVAAILRNDAMPGSGDGRSLVALDFATGTHAGPDPELVAGAVVDVVDRATVIRELGEQVLERRHDPLTPAWFEREMAARALPTGDTIPLEHYAGDPEQWLRSEAESWCDFLGYLSNSIMDISGHLAVLSEPEQRTAEQQLASALADCAAARAAWTTISTPFAE
jgi:hypothetical protein